MYLAFKKKMFTQSDRCGSVDKANNEGYARCTLQSVCVCVDGRTEKKQVS